MAGVVQGVLPGLEVEASPLILQLAAEFGLAALLRWSDLPYWARMGRWCPGCGKSGLTPEKHAAGCPAPLLLMWLDEREAGAANVAE